MSYKIIEELTVLVMCGYGGLVLIICYDVIRIFRRLVLASIVRVIIEDVIFWTVAALYIFQIFFQYNYGIPRYYGILAVLGAMWLFEYFVGRKIIDKCSLILKKILNTLLKPLKKFNKMITIKSKNRLDELRKSNKYGKRKKWSNRKVKSNTSKKNKKQTNDY